jgi:anti-anti-sigma factor
MQIYREHDAHRNGDLIILKFRGRISPLETSDAVDLGSLYGPEVFGRTVAFDLREADFLGSSGVNWLLTQRREFVEAGGRMAICCGEGSVLDVLRMMRLDRLIPIADCPESIPPHDPAS